MKHIVNMMALCFTYMNKELQRQEATRNIISRYIKEMEIALALAF